MIGGIGHEPKRDVNNGKIIIQSDSNNKHSNQFYRQKGGSIFFELASGGDLLEGLRTCLEVAKQENCTVNYSTCSSGIVPVTPEMSPQDTVNVFLCHEYSKKEPMSEDKKNKAKADAIKAEKYAPDAISLFQLGEAVRGNESKQAEIENFCKANDLDFHALSMHYKMALGSDIDFNTVVFHEPTKIDKKISESYGIPYLITKGSLPSLKEKFILSANSPKIQEIKKQFDKHPNSNTFQNE